MDSKLKITIRLFYVKRSYVEGFGYDKTISEVTRSGSPEISLTNLL